jgi:hypothetical protein
VLRSTFQAISAMYDRRDSKITRGNARRVGDAVATHVDALKQQG